LRIVNWIKWSFEGNQLPIICQNSLAVQARWLTKRLEYHLLGNHLFANAKALIFAGIFFSGKEAEAWLAKGLQILSREIPEQILDDGGQFERSTMYHALALEDMLDLANVLRQLPLSTDKLPSGTMKSMSRFIDRVESRIPIMMEWLSVMSHPDGEYALFNDAAMDIAPTNSELLEYAARLGFFVDDSAASGIQFLKSSGYIRLQNKIACALFDAAPVGPDYLPGHAHADTLSLELSIFGQRLFVNSGTSEYGISSERHRQRSTAAHNTVEVNGENSSEVWSGFRVARRAYPYDVQVSEEGESLRASAWHDGYKRLSPPVNVGRTLVLQPDALGVEDTIDGKFETAISRFHCHPAVKVAQTSPNVVQLSLHGGQTVRVVAPEGAKLSTQASTWHPKFGVVEPNVCIVIQLTSSKSVTTFEWSES
jgi:uncharacterized heparinase superfamily protein